MIASQFHPQRIRHRKDVLVPPARAIDDDDLVLAQRRRDAFGGGDGVGAFERGDDAFELGQLLEARERFFIGDGFVADAADARSRATSTRPASALARSRMSSIRLSRC